MTSIHEASRQGGIEAIRELIAIDPASVDADDEYEWRPIFHAALGRHVEVVRHLIEAGADLAAHDGYVLHYASEMPDNQEVVDLLIRYGALDAHVRPSDDLSRQLLAALFLLDRTRVGSLLSMHPELATTVDGRGDQPIHHAARCGDTETLRLLIASGADVNAINTRGDTVLYCAGGHGHLEAVHLLIDNGADIDARCTSAGMTLLKWLAQFPTDKRFTRIAAVLTGRRQRDQ